MNEENLINYYNKFNEDKRLNSRHGRLEFITTMKYINKYLSNMNNPKVLDIGAGCGRYSIEIANMNYDVTALELVKHNIRVIEQKSNKVKTVLGNALDLSKFKDNSFDLVLLFGPMYHLITKEEKITSLKEAKRVLKNNGILMVAYCMADYAIVLHGFMNNNIKDNLNNGIISNDYKLTPKKDDLYSYLTLDEINELNKEADLKRELIFTPDGPANYIRRQINALSEDEFELFIKYVETIAERNDLLGACGHTVDILKK